MRLDLSILLISASALGQTVNLQVLSSSAGGPWTAVGSALTITNPPSPSIYKLEITVTAGSANAMFSESLASYYTGKTNADQWPLWSDADMTPNSKCWLYPADVSGMWVGDGSVSATLSLVTPRHAVTPHHLGSEHEGTVLAFRGSDGVLYTNQVSRRTWAADDIDVIEFERDFPPAVQPFMVLASNYWEYLSRIEPLTMVWYRNNTGHVNAGYARFFNTIGQVQGVSAFTESVVTSGDSAGPMWLMAGNRLVLVGVLTSEDISGPMISFPPYWSAALPLLGTSHVDYLDLSGFKHL